jgi:hypothetical protein
VEMEPRMPLEPGADLRMLVRRLVPLHRDYDSLAGSG